MEVVLQAISTVGFPIACAVVMGWFIYRIYTNTTQENAENMEKVQARCKEREEKLYSFLEKAQDINNRAINTLERYDEKLDIIQEDLEIIKGKVLGE